MLLFLINTCSFLGSESVFNLGTFGRLVLVFLSSMIGLERITPVSFSGYFKCKLNVRELLSNFVWYKLEKYWNIPPLQEELVRTHDVSGWFFLLPLHLTLFFQFALSLIWSHQMVTLTPLSKHLEAPLWIKVSKYPIR